MKNNQSKGTRPSKDSGRFSSLLSPLIVGVIVLVGQAFLQPWVAEGVKRKESILEQRYKACERAVEIMQRYLAHFPIKSEQPPERYTPPEKALPTQVETNIAYTLLLIYGKDSTISERFYNAIGATGDEINPEDIFEFISVVRKELGVDKKGLTDRRFHYMFIKSPTK